MFLEVCVCPRGGHAWQGGMRGGGMHGGGHAWQGHAWWGVCMAGSVHGRGACMARGHVWQGGVHGGGHAWQGGACHPCPPQILRLWHTVNERAVRILLECILVYNEFTHEYTLYKIYKICC